MSSIAPPGVITETDALQAAPRWRREPFLLFFPLGIALSWLGVGHWLAHALGWQEEYRSIFHAMTQVQGFMMCFAVGFLFTMIPRRTGTFPPAPWEMAMAAVAPIVTVAAAWNEQWVLSQVGWLLLCAVLIAFVLRRFASATARRRPPNSFVWIPVALFMGVAGSLLPGGYALFGDDYLWMHEVGRNMLLQGMFVSLVLGVGGLALPLMTRAAPPPDGSPSPRDRSARAGHLLAAAVLLASFPLQTFYSLQLAMLLRAAVVLAVYARDIELWRLPTQPGWNRWLIWLAAWMVPLGFVVAAALPQQYKGGLHVTFIGGFALLAFGVSTQVTLGHGGYRSIMAGRPWQVAAIAALALGAVAARLTMELDREHFFHWMGVAAVLFLSATLVWAAFLIPKMIRPQE